MTAACEVLEQIRDLAMEAGSATPLSYWHIGEVLAQMDGKVAGLGDPAEVKDLTGLSARQLRDCLRVRSVFAEIRLEELVRAGACWSTLRVLASDRLNKDREKLVDDFLAGNMTDGGLRQAAEKVRRGRSKAGRGRGRRRKRPRCSAAVRAATRIRRLITPLARAVRMAVDILADGLDAAASDGTLDAATRRRLRTLDRALERLSCTVETLRRGQQTPQKAQ